jgi:ATP-binding cassette subfamily B protein/subfamily B ATP-binding cassette protein MsbA
MAGPHASSKAVFRDYLRRHREKRRAHGTGPSPEPVTPGDDTHKNKRHRSFWTLVRELWRIMTGHHAVVILALSTLTMSTVLGLLPPFSTKVAIDYIITDHPGPSGIPDWVPGPRGRESLLILLGATLVAITAVSAAVATWGRWHMTRLTKRMQVRIRRRVFDHALRLPLHRVYQIKSGGVASILREDAGGSAELGFALIYNPWRAIVQLIGTLIILAATDWRMLVGAVLLLPAVWLSHRTWIARIRPVFRDIRASRTHIDAHATEVFGGMRIVRGFARQRGEAGRFVRHGHLMARQEIFVWWWSRVVEIIWIMLIPSASAAVLVYGGTQVVRGNLSIGDVMMFSAYLFMLLSPLEVLVSTATNIQNQLAGFDRVLDLLAEPTELRGSEPLARAGGVVLPSAPLRLHKPHVRAHLSIQHLSFTYPASTDPVLSDITLDIPAGATVALVGPSGAGKTTLCNLVARFYDPTSGTILLDGVDLRNIDVGSYRHVIGIVEQDVFLFDGTIRENIAYARRRATLDDIKTAARAANADGFIDKLEKGYDTLIGERGVRLSGGQKQRIAIARAILADPRILILDEATSNLDSESEALIQASLKDLMKGRTCLVIAHRLSTIRHANMIVVLESGRVVETGPHDELVTKGGRYAQMLRRQVEATVLVNEPEV